MAGIRDVGRFFVFLAGGLVAIIVGSFMIRGTMHMWDNGPEEEKGKEKKGRGDGGEGCAAAGGKRKKRGPGTS